MINQRSRHNFKLFLIVILPVCVSCLQAYHKVVLIGTNDIHGAAFPTELVRIDTNETYQYGGLVYMARLIEILKEDNPGKTLFLDAGDQFQGGIQSSSLVSSGQIMNDFYNQVGLRGSAIGNHQFDFGPEFLQKYLQNRNSDNLAANLRSEKGQINFLKNQDSFKIYSINDFNVGVIGLSTVQTLTSSTAFVNHNTPTYEFLPYKQIVIQISSKLRAQGAHMIVILSHVGNTCQNNYTYGNWTKENSKQTCNKDQIIDLLDDIPRGTVDAVIQGHRHNISHYFYKDIPIMGAINGGYYFNAMHITYEKKSKKIKDIIIEGPIPVCQKVFQNTRTCNYMNQSELKKAGKLKYWQFHEKDVYAQPGLQLTYNTKWKPLMQQYIREICKNQVYLAIDINAETQLGNLITSLMHQVALDADFVILNTGLFRTAWAPGTIKYQNYYAMFPFAQKIKTFQITGKQLIEILYIIQSSKKTFYYVWNLYNELKYIPSNNTRIFVSAKFYNGTNIDNETIYKGVSTDFLLNGGDDFENISKSYNFKNEMTVGQFKELIESKLSELGVIEKNVWIDPQHPRLNITII